MNNNNLWFNDGSTVEESDQMNMISDYGLGFNEFVIDSLDFIRNLDEMEACKKRPLEENTSESPQIKKQRTSKAGIIAIVGGKEFDISGIPTPVCTCTGTPRRCYRRGKDGWQSVCCTATISMYPLPLNPVRFNERIKGRKIGHNAFHIVLNKLWSEGYNFYKTIDLKEYWGKRGSNQYSIKHSCRTSQ